MAKRKVDEMIDKLVALNEQKEQIEKEIEETKEYIKSYMIKYGKDEMLGLNGEHIIWRPVVSNRFDTTAFKKEFGELYARFTKKTETKPFKFYK